jgi:hypothetical protein
MVLKQEELVSNPAKWALTLGLGGVVLAVFTGLLGGLVTGRDFTLPAYGIFIAFQVAAIVLGMMARHSVIGRSAAIILILLLLCSVLLLR